MIDGVQYLVWAQKDPAIEGNSNLYIAKMANPWTLGSEPVMLTKPEYDWECIDFLVNEGPAFLFHENKIYITYSASGTGVPYAVGLLTAVRVTRRQHLLDKASWTKSRCRCSRPAPRTVSMVRATIRSPSPRTAPRTDDLPLPQLHGNQGRSAVRPESPRALGVVKWTADGPDFGVPELDNLWTPTTTDVLPADGGPLAGTPAVGH